MSLGRVFQICGALYVKLRWAKQNVTGGAAEVDQEGNLADE